MNEKATPKIEAKTKRMTEFSPFNFKTEERIGKRRDSDADESSKCQ
jgi:hypothetical protein